ncbi:Kelch repeat-containing protein [Kineococcus sp. SYSU DK001]|uniref:hypothetical protein n=1 Tax=Kineococcus sp. SYSU DK001 TaxID=3383122 RepID=UPI003D7E8DDD
MSGTTRRAVVLGALAAPLLTACRDTPPEAAPRVRPSPDVRGWTELPAAPIGAPVLRRGQAGVWTGEQVLVWGGASPRADGCAVAVTADGAAWTPGGADRRGSWATLAAAPLEPRSGAGFWWTGSSAVVVGGVDPWAECETRPAGRLDVAAYDPGTGSWLRWPDLPWPAGTVVDASGWTGEALLVFSVSAGAWTLRPGGAAWTRLPDPPLAPQGPSSRAWLNGWWTGSEWLLLGAAHDAAPVPVGLALDPARPAWRVLDPGPLAGYAVDAVWTGTELLAFDPAAGLSRLDPATGRWSRGGPGPLDGLGGRDDGPVLAWTGTELLVWGGYRAARDGGGVCMDGNGVDDAAFAYGGTCNPATGPLAAAHAPATGAWRSLPDGPWQRRTGSTAVWTGRELFLAGGVDLEERRAGGTPPFPDRAGHAFAVLDPSAGG